MPWVQIVVHEAKLQSCCLNCQLILLRRSLLMASGLGVALAGILFVFRHAIAKVFTTDPHVLLFISGEAAG